MKKILITSLTSLTLIGAFVSCEKFLEYPPTGAILAEDALKTPADAQKLLVSCYDVMANLYDGKVQNINELMGDNLAEPNGLDFNAIYNRETNFFTPTTNGVYGDFYYAIYRCNSLLKNFDLIEGLTAEERTRMEAEAKFIRAFCHWGVVKMYAQPYGSTPTNNHLGIIIRSEASNEPLPRNTVAEVYEFILSDLAFAIENLPTSNGNYANKDAATALMGMVYFQMNDFQNAVNYINQVVDNYPMSDTLDRFPDNPGVNPEIIFGIVSSNPGAAHIDQRTDNFVGNYNSGGALPPNLMFNNEFYNFVNLNSADDRLGWMQADGGKYRNLRFKDKIFFNIPIIYTSELRLIRAEALAELGQNLGTAIEDINAIRDRAFGIGLNDLDANSTAAQIIDAARREYRIETMGEGKWVDQLKRRGAKGENIIVRGAPWNCDGMALQFPNSEFTSALFVGNPEGGCQ
jgi:tetratricopeptide (TPR) repeat protein